MGALAGRGLLLVCAITVGDVSDEARTGLGRRVVRSVVIYDQGIISL